MNYKGQKEQAVIDYLKGIHSDHLVCLYNEYASSTGNELIFNNDEETLNDIFNNDAMGAIRAVCYGSYHYTDGYVRFNGYGNLESFDEFNLHEYIDFDDLSDWVIRNTPQEVVESLEEILPDIFKSLLETDGVSVTDDEDIIDSVIDGYDIIDDDWDELADEVKKEIEKYYSEGCK